MRSALLRLGVAAPRESSVKALTAAAALATATTTTTTITAAGATVRRLFSSHTVGDLPRSRSVQQEQLAEGSDSESAQATGRPVAWPARSPDAPPDPATRRGGRETMPDERSPEEAARLTVRQGSGKSAEAILAGPEAAEAPHSNTAVKFVYQQQPSPDSRDTDVGTTSERAVEQVAQLYLETAGTSSETVRGGPTDDIPDLGGMSGVLGPHGEMASEYGLRSPRQPGSRAAMQEGGGGGGGGSADNSGTSEAKTMMDGTAGRSTGGGGGHSGWSNVIAGDGVSETVKAGVSRLEQSYRQMFGEDDSRLRTKPQRNRPREPHPRQAEQEHRQEGPTHSAGDHWPRGGAGGRGGGGGGVRGDGWDSP